LNNINASSIQKRHARKHARRIGKNLIQKK